ncbi:unnamed protein product, partial [Pleuronectes platessa]
PGVKGSVVGVLGSEFALLGVGEEKNIEKGAEARSRGPGALNHFPSPDTCLSARQESRPQKERVANNVYCAFIHPHTSSQTAKSLRLRQSHYSQAEGLGLRDLAVLVEICPVEPLRHHRENSPGGVDVARNNRKWEMGKETLDKEQISNWSVLAHTVTSLHLSDPHPSEAPSL